MIIPLDSPILCFETQIQPIYTGFSECQVQGTGYNISKPFTDAVMFYGLTKKSIYGFSFHLLSNRL